jgi:hypothetical protein
VIDDQANFVTLHGWTERTDVGDDAYVLLARVRFASSGDDQVPVVPKDGFLGPYDMTMVLEDGQTRLVNGSTPVPALDESPDTELWADFDRSGRVDFGGVGDPRRTVNGSSHVLANVATTERQAFPPGP